jgi:hypothetical protein
MWQHVRRLGSWASLLCGWYLVYFIAIESFIRFAATDYPNRTECWPYWSVFGAVQTNCHSRWLDSLWAIFVELPHLPFLIPAIAIAARLSGGYEAWLLVDNFLLLSIPVAIIWYAGHRYWNNINPFVAWLITLVLASQIGVLAGRM